MKKLLALLLTALLAMPALLMFPSSPVLAESNTRVTVSHDLPYDDLPMFESRNAAFNNWLRALLTADAPCESAGTRASDYRYLVRFTSVDSGETEEYAVRHDRLYNKAWVTRPDGSVHSVSADLPEMLYHALNEQITFDIPEEHRSLLQKYGWTIAFRHPHMLVQLPAKLEASRTDPAALHFTWAELFLRDADFDVTPYLGKAVVPYVYTLYDTVPRSAFHPAFVDDVRYSLCAVVLEYNGQVIGAYLKAYSWDGSDLMSIKGNTAPALLGEQTVTDYLLERLPMMEAERETAALTPEEVITRYGAINNPQLMAISVLLESLATANAGIYDPLALTAIPTGDTVRVTRSLGFEEQHMYEVKTRDGLRFPALVYESPETGWKIESFYNTGF